MESNALIVYDMADARPPDFVKSQVSEPNNNNKGKRKNKKIAADSGNLS